MASLLQKLRNRFDEARAIREEREAKLRPLKERIEVIVDAPRFVNTDFWCNTCKRDCSGTGYKQVISSREKCPIAWYSGTCPKGHKMIRRITDKNTDPYYDLSYMIARQRAEMADALLTPDDPRFKLLYPKQYEDLMGKALRG